MKGSHAPFVAVSVSATAPAVEYQSFRSSCTTCDFRGAENGGETIYRERSPDGAPWRGRLAPSAERRRLRPSGLARQRAIAREKVESPLRSRSGATSNRSCSPTSKLREPAKAPSSARPSDRFAAVSGRSGAADFDEELNV